jgi:TonB family protein
MPSTLARWCLLPLALTSLAVAAWRPVLAQETVKPLQGNELGCPTTEMPTSKGCLPWPKIKKDVPPRFPDDARIAGVSDADVVITCLIGADGQVVQPIVVHSSHPGYGFEASALEAVKKRRYRPVLVDGTPVMLEWTIKMTFRQR